VTARSLTARAATGLAAGCIGAGTILVLITVARTSITFDEPYFYSYGRRILFAGTFERPDPIDYSKLPVSALNALPEWVFARTRFKETGAGVLLQRWFDVREAAYITEHLALYAGRLVTVGFYTALCCLVFAWGCEIYGPSAALAATALFAFLPTALGHAGLVTADAAATCAIFAAVYAVARSLLAPSLGATLVAGLALGLAQLVKYTAVELAPIAVVMLLIRTATADRSASRWQTLRSGGMSLTAAALVAVAVVNLGFAFQGTGVRIVDLPCHSRACQSLRALLGNLPIPLPYEYLNGLDLVIFLDESGIGGGNIYLLGEINRDGFWSYYVVATLLKTPLAFLALLVFRPWRRQRLYYDFVLLTPVLWFFVHLSFFFRTQLGLRFFLPAFPFLALLAAGNWDSGRRPPLRLTASAILGLYVATMLLQCPRYLSYFNVLIGPRLNAYRYLADSNLDWGQDLFALWGWERAHRSQRYALEPYFPTEGLIVVRANDFIGINDPDAYAWLRKRAAPIAAIGDSYLVFDVPETARDEMRSPPTGSGNQAQAGH